MFLSITSESSCKLLELAICSLPLSKLKPSGGTNSPLIKSDGSCVAKEVENISSAETAFP